MNAFVRKEVRLLFSAWVSILALELILPWFWKNPADAMSAVPTLLFFGIVILAVTSFGREFSQGTFLSLLSQPIERREIWRTKITVLFVGAVLIFAGSFAGSALRLHLMMADSDWNGHAILVRDDYRTKMLGSVAVLLVALTSGLWTTLLLRQITAALWVSVLTPVALLSLIGIIMSQLFKTASDAANEMVIYCAAGIYFVSAFWLSRRLFHSAQEVGWSGGVITLPEWKWFGAASDAANLPRKRKPIFALLKKEFQLQQVSMIGAAGLFLLHLGVIAWRSFHTFEKDSAGEVLTSIFWMLWLVVPVVIGCMAVAEERKLGVMEGQLCLPVSRRLQFIVKGFFVLIAGTLLGGVLPLLMENIAAGIGVHNSMFTAQTYNEFGFSFLDLSAVALAASLALVSFFASSLAKNFLQAIGFAIATVVVCGLIFMEITNWRVIFFNSISGETILPNLIAVPTIVALLLWLAYLNFKNFRDGWRLLRRTLLGFAVAFVFTVVMSIALYNRVWEIFEPAEPPHGAAKLFLPNPPRVRPGTGNNFLVHLPDGRVWNVLLEDARDYSQASLWRHFLQMNVLPKGTDRSYIVGSNWASVIVAQSGYPFDLKAVGIQQDGSLWFFHKSENEKLIGDGLTRLGSETNWQQMARSQEGLLLLKDNGTLWRWDRNDWDQLNRRPNFELTRVSSNADWKELFYAYPGFARKADGSVWIVEVSKGKVELRQKTSLEQVVFQTLSQNNNNAAFVRPDGTLWVGNFYSPSGKVEFQYLQFGKETNWVAAAVSYNMMITLKSDGSLWQWNFQRESMKEAVNASPIRLGIHNDWVAITSQWESVIALAADGSLWLWPDRAAYEYGALLKLPKQPRLLGNVFGKTD